MNDETDNDEHDDAEHRHPPRAEFVDAALALGDDLLGRLQEEAAERFPDWCPAIRTQVCYEAACIHLGILDGDAVAHGVERGGLDRSLRTGMHAGRSLALGRHRDDGCVGCENSVALERLLETH